MNARFLFPALLVLLTGCNPANGVLASAGFGKLNLNVLAVTTVDPETQTVSSKAYVRWPTAPGAKTYEVIRTFGTNPAKVVATIGDTSYTDTSLGANQTAIFKVRALSGENKELTTTDDKSVAVQAQTVGKPELTAPADNASLGVGDVPTLTWKPVTGATWYYVKVVRGDNDSPVYNALTKDTSIKFGDNSPLKFDNFGDLFPTDAKATITRGIIFRWTVQAIRADAGTDPNAAKGIDVNASPTFKFSQG
ncbi:MAG: hypothetical protein JWM80_5667 [Cyanobacteria bacterium RYN_339]|nr:hypothetical protein [Cyanobacteria bacterium RYN_339]